MLSNTGDLFLERNNSGLNFVQSKVRNTLGCFVRKTTQLIADIGQDLAGDDEADVFVDDWGKSSRNVFYIIKYFKGQ